MIFNSMIPQITNFCKSKLHISSIDKTQKRCYNERKTKETIAVRISTEIHSAAKHVGERRALELVAAAGFDAYDLSMFAMAPYDYKTKAVTPSDHPLNGPGYAAFAKELAHVARECGLVCNQSHAPFPSMAAGMKPFLFRAIECTAIAGGKICIIHPNNDLSAEENAAMYAELLPFAKECGVRIATENMWNWDREKAEALPAACSHHDDFLRHIEAVNDPYLVACLDIGHAEMRGLATSAGEMIRTLGPHLQAIHLHDNDLHHDSHAIPFSMQIDLDAAATALAEIGYAGDITLECDRHLAAFTPDTVGAGLCEMAAAARRFAAMVENARG